MMFMVTHVVYVCVRVCSLLGLNRRIAVVLKWCETEKVFSPRVFFLPLCPPYFHLLFLSAELMGVQNVCFFPAH